MNGLMHDVSAAAVRGAPLIVPEGLSFLVGPPKIRQSWLVGQIGLGLAGGTTVLRSRQGRHQARCCTSALEDGRAAPAGPLPQDPRQGRGYPEADALHHESHTAADHSDDHRVPGPLPGQQPVIFLDTFGKVKPPKRANQESYQADYEIARAS